MSQHKGILIYCEMDESGLAPITTELLGIGRRLADELGEQVLAVLMGSRIAKDYAHECIYFGAEKVFVMDRSFLENYSPDVYASASENLIERIKPDIVLFGQTSVGRDIAPRLAYKLKTGVTLDCIDLAIDPQCKLMLQTKPVYGGKAYGVYVCESKPQIASVRPKTFSSAERSKSRTGEIINFDPGIDFDGIRARVVERIRGSVATGAKLEEAEVVVCGGRGIDGDEGFALLRELAELLEAAVGGTRPVCDYGWIPAQNQIGLTGKLVSPSLYVGIALSGATQHLAGMMGSKIIVAVNEDPEANIFRVADYGVVGDYRKVVPSLIEKYKELNSNGEENGKT